MLRYIHKTESSIARYQWNGGVAIGLFYYKKIMCRKQPIPTSFLNNPSLDVFDKMLFAYLRSKTYNSDQYINFYHWNKYLDFELKRWQCFFIISELVKSIWISRGRVEKSLKKIQKTENEMQIEKKPYGCIITWVWYDERVKMKNESEPETKTKQKRNKNEVKSIEYSDKSVEIVESENINNKKEEVSIFPTLEEVVELRNDIPELKKTRKITKDIRTTRSRIIKTYTPDDFQLWVSNYINEIRSRKPWSWYYDHRFTFYEFIKQWNWLQKFINS